MSSSRSANEEEEERSDRSNEQRRKSKTLDRISALPDAVRLHILSLLSMHDVVKTSSLSKNWQHLWTTVPNLVFTNHNKPADRVSDFVGFVDQTLIQCRHSKVHKFSLYFKYEPHFESHVDKWIQFATRCDVQHLSIEIEGISRYTLPEHIFSCSSITNLKLRYCNVVPMGLITWNSLKSLWLQISDLSDDAIHNILSGSPLLEVLQLELCAGFKHLDIASTRLRKLIINGSPRFIPDSIQEQESILEISAPNLQSLRIVGLFYRGSCRLVNMLSLGDAYLSFYAEPNMYNEVLQSLSHVNELTLGYIYIGDMPRLEMKHLNSLSKRKWLRLCTYIVPSYIPGIEDLLQSSVDLETLIIHNPSPYNVECHGASIVDPFNSEAYWTSRERIFPCLQLHLKTVKIVGFHGSDLEIVLPFVAFLLKNACVLEKMEISTGKVSGKHSCCASKELLKVAQKLLNCPRSSQNAVVMFTE